MARSEHAMRKCGVITFDRTRIDGAMNIIIVGHPYVMFFNLISTHTSGE